MTAPQQRERLREALCPNFEDHTFSPEGYIEWHTWAENMAKTHRQIRCKGCDRFSIWIPRSIRPRRKAAPWSKP